MKKIDEEQIKNIKDGWLLTDGRLYLLINCEDGVLRSLTLDMKKKDNKNGNVKL